MVSGTNAHVVAYGATHSGKAYTMQGDEKSTHPVPGDDHKDHEHDHNGVVNKVYHQTNKLSRAYVCIYMYVVLQ